MLPPVLHSALFALLGLLLSPMAVIYASPSPADSVHFSCQLVDHEQLERDRPLPAAKRLADLNVGAPRAVRLIYFLPNDRPYRADVVQNMKTQILEIQTFYAEQMAVHGHGNKTFQIETDAQSELIVHRVDGQHPNSHYSVTTLFRELVFDETKNVYFILFDGWRTAARGGRVGRNGGAAVVSEDSGFGVSAHELGHAFGLKHDFRDNAYLMSYGGNQRNSLSACAAEFLAVHPYFNPDIPLEAGPPPTIELISPTEYPADSESVPIRLRVSDSEGLHQVLLLINDGAILSSGSVKACSGLAGENDAVVEFDYDGISPGQAGTNLYHIRNHPLAVVAVDTEGNEGNTSFTLWSPWEEDSPQHITTLEGRGDIRSVAFSPDGTILAYTGYKEVKLWDVANRTNIATLEVPGASFVNSVAFSPDGTILAYTEFTKIKLWDVAGRTNIATLEGHTGEIKSVVFSPDGTTLASGATDETVKLWDVATRQNVATLVGHKYAANSVVFSPDGTTLASGGRRKILLWDVATRTNIATLEETGIAYTMSFSPDGTMLSFAGATLGSKVITLWDVATHQNIGTLVGHESDRVIRSVVFSPDGTTLASGSYDRKVKLWDMATLTNIATLEGHRNGVKSVAFSPDGTVLASASQDETVKLWDTSEWMAPITLDTSDLAMTVGGGPSAALRGYNPHSLPEWNFGSLSSQAFVLDGVSYTLHKLVYNVAGKVLQFQTSPMLRGFELHLDTHVLRSFSAHDYNLHLWENVSLNWSVGQSIRIRVVEATPVPPGPPTNLVATSGDKKVTLSWKSPANADPTLPITEYEFRVSDDGGSTWDPDWEIIPDSRSGQDNRMNYTVEDDDGLTNGTTYTFEIRAKGGDGPGAVAHATAVPGGTTAAATDFNGDGKTDFVDFFLFADAYGGTDPRFDLDGSGTVDFVDFFKFVDAFGS